LYTTLEHKVQERTREAEEARRVAETANQAKTEFLAHMSHELRTPLNAVLGYTQLLKRDKELMETHHDAVTTIHRSGEHLLLMINELLDLSRIEARTIELKPTPMSLPGFLKSLVEMIQVQAQQKGLAFSHDIPSILPAVVQADEQRLRQILLNLLNNALKFTEKGSVTLRVNARSVGVLEYWSTGEESAQTPTPTLQHSNTPILLSFEVSDTGIGIPADHIQDIFSPFHQVSTTRTGREGIGLGLAISQQLVRLMGSELQVKSAVGQGTLFWFDLELPVLDTPDGRHLEGGAHLEHYIVGFKGGTRTLLLVDDNTGNLAFVRDVLSPLGFEIMEAADGREALDKFIMATDQSVIASQAKQSRHDIPDLILMDLLMPGMDGFEATRQIRKLETGNWKLETREPDFDTDSYEFPVSSFQFRILSLACQPVSLPMCSRKAWRPGVMIFSPSRFASQSYWIAYAVI
jgi:signal transduction histidine kinase